MLFKNDEGKEKQSQLKNWIVLKNSLTLQIVKFFILRQYIKNVKKNTKWYMRK